MSCILRVFGKSLHTSNLCLGTTLRPYRVDQDGAGSLRCAHYDVYEVDPASFKQSLAIVSGFLIANSTSLAALKNRSDVEGVEIDLMIEIPADDLMKSLRLHKATIKTLSEFDVDLVLSLYKVEECGES